eukprot:gene44202-54046_t
MEEVPRARLSLLKNRVKLRVPVVQLVSEEEKSEEKISSEPEVSRSSSSSAVRVDQDVENSQPQLCYPGLGSCAVSASISILNITQTRDLTAAKNAPDVLHSTVLGCVIVATDGMNIHSEFYCL